MRTRTQGTSIFAVALISVFASACQEDAAIVDMAVSYDLARTSECGHPGDKGNSKGVGKYCEASADCASNTDATICTRIADPNNFFCTFSCKATGPADQCGENAFCACDGSLCGCKPTACGGPSNDLSSVD
jgi:hypothetical protein